MDSQKKIPNRLIDEQSPYLLQHAYNPVDWYPWGEEAFEKARLEDKPVFLSIGYSTCHWCHVMEEESFEDHEVAEYLNKHFISIKVDKEERPDIDAVYMSVCQALTGSGGWPMTILLTPEQKPFFAGTYFPKYSRYGQPGLPDLLKAIIKKWDSDREDLLNSSEEITEAVKDAGFYTADESHLDRKPIEQAAKSLSKSFDERYGGFGSPPKFPTPHNLLFLLRCHALEVGTGSLEMVEKTLQCMYKGGIFDHIGFGFSRYSTDEKWLVPHFEKMLYDNALLTMAFLECYQITKNPLYKNIIEKTLLYIEREMTSPEGGFYSAQDADIDGEEGKYYTFSRDEIIQLLGEKDGMLFCNRYDVTPKGNFEGTNIPNLLQNKDASLPDAHMEDLISKLYEYREKRFKLHKDDKIITSWNALMIIAYAKSYRILGNEKYLHFATDAVHFIQKNLMDDNGELMISYRNGKAKGHGILDDYAFLTWAYLELYDATFSIQYLEEACKLSKIILTLFSDPDGGFYLTSDNSERLILRPKEQFDGAIPSGNSVAAWCLARLSALTGESSWREAVDRQLRFFSNIFNRQPTASTFALMALMLEVYPTKELMCVIMNESDKSKLSHVLGEHFQPQVSTIVKTKGNAGRLGEIAPHTTNYSATSSSQEYTFYLCQNQSCSAPFYNIEELLQHLKAEHNYDKK